MVLRSDSTWWLTAFAPTNQPVHTINALQHCINGHSIIDGHHKKPLDASRAGVCTASGSWHFPGAVLRSVSVRFLTYNSLLRRDTVRTGRYLAKIGVHYGSSIDVHLRFAVLFTVSLSTIIAHIGPLDLETRGAESFWHILTKFDFGSAYIIYTLNFHKLFLSLSLCYRAFITHLHYY